VPSDVTASISYGATVLDSTSLSPTLFTLEVDASGSTLRPCKAGGTVSEAGYVRLSFTTPASNTVYTQRVALYYPQ
jgi:hypothetical protein